MANDINDLSEKFRRWAFLKENVVEPAQREMNKLRDPLMSHVSIHGDADEKGSQFWSFPQPVCVGDREYKGIKREARVSTTLNEDAAIQLAEDKKLPGVVILVPQVDQDALYAAYQRGQITEAELDGLFEIKTTYAFKPASSAA